jgi:CDP-diacylglycerol--glycerol-3-phosphate 3-phosphatidyltransferase
MIAIALLFAVGIFEHYFLISTSGIDPQILDDILSSTLVDSNHLLFYYNGMYTAWFSGITLLWAAATLTVITGVDYFRKALPHLRD